MKAIETVYKGPTSNRGGRYIARDLDGKRAVVSSGAVTDDHGHAAAARALCLRLGWTGRLIGGATRAGMAWVFDPGLGRADEEIRITAADVIEAIQARRNALSSATTRADFREILTRGGIPRSTKRGGKR